MTRCCSPRTVRLGPATAACSRLATATRRPRPRPRGRRRRARCGARAALYPGRNWTKASSSAGPARRGDRDGAGCSRLRPDGGAGSAVVGPTTGAVSDATMSGIRRLTAAAHRRARALLFGLRSARGSRREPPPCQPATAGVRRRSSPPADRSEYRHRVASYRATYTALCAGGSRNQRGFSLGDANSASPNASRILTTAQFGERPECHQSFVRFECPNLGRCR